jgi:hypothetical protein
MGMTSCGLIARALLEGRSIARDVTVNGASGVAVLGVSADCLTRPRPHIRLSEPGNHLLLPFLHFHVAIVNSLIGRSTLQIFTWTCCRLRGQVTWNPRVNGHRTRSCREEVRNTDLRITEQDSGRAKRQGNHGSIQPDRGRFVGKNTTLLSVKVQRHVCCQPGSLPEVR